MIKETPSIVASLARRAIPASPIQGGLAGCYPPPPDGGGRRSEGCVVEGGWIGTERFRARASGGGGRRVRRERAGGGAASSCFFCLRAKIDEDGEGKNNDDGGGRKDDERRATERADRRKKACCSEMTIRPWCPSGGGARGKCRPPGCTSRPRRVSYARASGAWSTACGEEERKTTNNTTMMFRIS